MTGIAGFITAEQARTDGLLLAAMLDDMRHEPWHRAESYVDVDGQLALGRVSLGFVNTAPQPVQLADHGLIAVMDGELYQPQRYRAELERAGSGVHGGGR